MWKDKIIGKYLVDQEILLMPFTILMEMMLMN